MWWCFHSREDRLDANSPMAVQTVYMVFFKGFGELGLRSITLTSLVIESALVRIGSCFASDLTSNVIDVVK